jgi:hypothetical protein
MHKWSLGSHSKVRIPILVKVKQSLYNWTGPEDSRKLRLPYFKATDT